MTHFLRQLGLPFSLLSIGSFAMLVASTVARADAAPAASTSSWVGLPRSPRAISQAWSASRDAPVLELAYGPRAQLSLGHELGLFATGRSVVFSTSIAALLALEDAESHAPLPDELARLLGNVGFALSLPSASERLLGSDSAIEFGFRVGVERARELRAAETDAFVPRPLQGDIPFGGGGLWTGFDAAIRARLAPRFTVAVRIAERVFIGGWPLLFGARAESDAIANTLGNGLSHAPSLDLTVRFCATSLLRPTASLFVEGLVPQDATAHFGYFVRGWLGLGLAGAFGEAIPFVSLDVGNGKGFLVNRHELRLSFGARYVFL